MTIRKTFLGLESNHCAYDYQRGGMTRKKKSLGILYPEFLIKFRLQDTEEHISKGTGNVNKVGMSTAFPLYT